MEDMSILTFLEALDKKEISKELEKFLDVVSLCRDINSDFPKKDFEREFREIEKIALEAFKQILFKQENRGRINVVTIGNFSSGKSSIINCLFGKEICPTKVSPTTSSITRFIYGEKERIFLIGDNGKKEEISYRGYLILSQHQLGSMSKTKSYLFEYQYPSELLESIILYDTPGFENPKNKLDEKLTEELFCKKADAVIFVQDISKPSLEQETLKRIKKLQSLKKGIPWILILNKADVFSEKELEDIRNYWNRQEIKSLFDDIIIYSAKEIMKLYQKEEILREVKEKIFQILFFERKILLFIEDKVKTLFRKKRKQNRKLKLVAETDSEKLEVEIEIPGEKVKLFKENHEKLLNKLKELASEKDKLLDRKIFELKNLVVSKAKGSLKKIKVSPELFEPIKSYEDVINQLNRAKQEHISSVEKACMSNRKSEKDWVMDRVLMDCFVFAKHVLKTAGISLEVLDEIEQTVKLESNSKDPKELVELFYLYLLRNLEGQLLFLKKKAKERAEQVKEKLEHLENIIAEL